MTGFALEIEKFKGPIELLLELIENRKMHISDVSLTQVADAFLAYIEGLGELPVADTANFVYVASILLLIKSKSLLPGLELTEEEEGSIDELAKRLEVFRLLKEQTNTIHELFGKNIIFTANEPRDLRVVFSAPETLTTTLLEQVAREVLASAPKNEERLEERTVKKIVSLEEMIERLHERISSNLRMSFKQFSGLEKGEKVEVIVSFLAMLELVKRGVITVNQTLQFKEIEMESLSTSTPSYK
ncbi:MAG TPA: segregation/condensation protein A [Candidatus Paceibacterota bacterium]